MALLDNDRLAHWFLAVLFGWTVCFLIIGYPIFHLGLDIPLMRVAVFVSAACALQLMFVPWLYSARATPQNPNGHVLRRALAVLTWLSSMTLFLFYFVQRGVEHDSAAQAGRFFMLLSLVAVLVLLIFSVAVTRDNIRAFIIRLNIFRTK